MSPDQPPNPPSGSPDRTSSGSPDQTQTVPPSALLTAVRRLLRPLVRLMMKSGVTFPILSDTLRQLFVEVAIQEILVDPRSQTDSRVSILSGVHRKEIKRLRSLPVDRMQTPEVITLASQVVARWLGSPAFTDSAGQPRILLRQAQAQPDPEAAASFDDLVQTITTDVRPRAVLDDLVSHGVVTLLDNDRIRLNIQAFIPRPGGAEQLFYFARNLHDHVAAASANVSAEIPPYFDRSVHYDALTSAQAEALHAYAREVGLRALLDVNRKALELLEEGMMPASDPAIRDGRERVNLGIFLYRDRDDASGAPT